MNKKVHGGFVFIIFYAIINIMWCTALMMLLQNVDQTDPMSNIAVFIIALLCTIGALYISEEISKE